MLLLNYSQFNNCLTQTQSTSLVSILLLLARLHEVETALELVEVSGVVGLVLAGLVGLQVVVLLVRDIVVIAVGKVTPHKVVAVLVLLLTVRTTVVHQTVLVRRYALVPLATVRKLLHLKPLLYQNILHIVRQIIYLVLRHLHLTARHHRLVR